MTINIPQNKYSRGLTTHYLWEPSLSPSLEVKRYTTQSPGVWCQPPMKPNCNKPAQEELKRKGKCMPMVAESKLHMDVHLDREAVLSPARGT